MPFGNRTDRPRHFSVKNIVPSCKNAMSHGLLSPDINTERTSAGATGPPGGDGGDGDGAGAGAGAGAEPVASLLPEQPTVAIAAATPSEHQNSNATRRFITAPRRRRRERAV
ncbi:MAG: hypothetical protein OHK0044_03150 [Burkholderiaceae bacterium]